MPPERSTGNIANGSNIDERQPLLSGPLKLPTVDVASIEDSSDADLRVILPALMACAFLAAFDITVVAAIYPIM
jgi:hypothetical protein